MYSPPVAFHSSQVSSLFLDGGQTTSFCANHWYLSSCEHIFLSSYYPNFATFYSFLQNFCASDSNMMWRFARRCLLSDQLRHVLSKQNKSKRPLPILLQRLESQCIHFQENQKNVWQKYFWRHVGNLFIWFEKYTLHFSWDGVPDKTAWPCVCWPRKDDGAQVPHPKPMGKFPVLL